MISPRCNRARAENSSSRNAAVQALTKASGCSWPAGIFTRTRSCRIRATCVWRGHRPLRRRLHSAENSSGAMRSISATFERRGILPRTHGFLFDGERHCFGGKNDNVTDQDRGYGHIKQRLSLRSDLLSRSDTAAQLGIIGASAIVVQGKRARGENFKWLTAGFAGEEVNPGSALRCSVTSAQRFSDDPGD